MASAEACSSDSESSANPTEITTIMKTTIAIIVSAFVLGTAGTSLAADKTKSYTKDVCIVTDNKLGSMGRVITKTYEGQEVKFCCKPCVSKFEKNPAKYLSKL